MLTDAITFVIGAGAGVPYGLPTGADLLHSARMMARESVLDLVLHEACRDLEEGSIDRVLTDLKNAPVDSIDGFLARRPDPVCQAVGRRLIAMLIGQKILSLVQSAGDRRDWVEYLFSRMAEGANTWSRFIECNGRLRFVTFNFDTLFEIRANQFLCRLYGPAGSFDVSQFWNNGRMIHVHGILAGPTPQPQGDFRVGIPNDTPSASWIVEAANGIKVVHDATGDEVVNAATQAVSEAARLVFLGFGFNADNLGKLGLPGGQSKPAWGSSTKMHEGRRQEVVSSFGVRRDDRGGIHPLMTLAGAECDCLKTLQSFPLR